ASAGSLRELPPHPRGGGAGLTLRATMALGLSAPFAAPHHPLDQDLLHMLPPPMWAPDGSSSYPLGTDGLGRCVLSRAIYGARVALTVAIAAAWGSMLLGSTLALIGGYFGGLVDRLISYVVDLWMSF